MPPAISVLPLTVLETHCPGCSSECIAPVASMQFLYVCSVCSLVFDNLRPSVEAIASHYNCENQYDDWLQHLEDRERLWRRRLQKMCRHQRLGNLLDIGTGIGQFLNQVRHTFAPVLGTEISKTAIATAKKLYDPTLLPGDLESVEISDHFDNVTAFHVLEHVHSPGRFLQRCCELLAPGGRLFVAVPNELENLGALKQKFRGQAPLKPLSCMQAGAEIHLSHFTSKSLPREPHATVRVSDSRFIT